MTFGLKHVTQIPTPEQNIQIHSYTIVSKDRLESWVDTDEDLTS